MLQRRANPAAVDSVDTPKSPDPQRADAEKTPASEPILWPPPSVQSPWASQMMAELLMVQEQEQEPSLSSTKLLICQPCVNTSRLPAEPVTPHAPCTDRVTAASPIPRSKTPKNPNSISRASTPRGTSTPRSTSRRLATPRSITPQVDRSRPRSRPRSSTPREVCRSRTSGTFTIIHPPKQEASPKEISTPRRPQSAPRTRDCRPQSARRRSRPSSRTSVACSAVSAPDIAESALAVKAQPTIDFATLDTDQNGAVDVHEFKAAGGTEADFNRLDANKDGVLYKEELEAARRRKTRRAAADSLYCPDDGSAGVTLGVSAPWVDSAQSLHGCFTGVDVLQCNYEGGFGVYPHQAQ